ncbi:MAG: T9SS type A sorting domain-containing protein [Chitinophagaceae bacterium]|nr:T9SS type A sorting domain-containing protein [Chitinophagaceae bacterium]
MKLIVNGVTINAALPFPKTSGSAIFSNTVTAVNFAGGNNDIRLESIASNATADIDWIEITGNSPATGNCVAARPINAVITSSNTSGKNGLYPNPATREVTIGFYLPEADNVSISIINANGAIIDTPVSKMFNKGYHQLRYDVSGKAAGIYHVVINSKQQEKKILKLLVQ